MKKIFNRRGLTLMEVIVSLGILGVVIVPLMSIFIFCGKLLNICQSEYEAAQTAQYYLDEIKAMDGDMEFYSYNDEKEMYERVVVQDNLNYGAEIRIVPDNNGILHRIEIDVIDEGQVINSLRGSVIFE